MTDASATEQKLDAIAAANGVSTDAARTLLEAIRAGGGRMAQFSHPELGGMGQWSYGGMLMIGDMFNNGLKAKVDRLCHELADFAAQEPAPAMRGGSRGMGGGGMGGGSRWWPDGLCNPSTASTAGAQNDMRYAFFPSDRRLVISQNGALTVYDTGELMISGVSQQQGGSSNLSFSSQFGQVDLASLTRVPTEADEAAEAPVAVDEPTPAPDAMPTPDREPTPESGRQESGRQDPPEHAAAAAPHAPAPSAGHDDIFHKLERLGELQKKGILSDAEFQAKKTELLSRL